MSPQIEVQVPPYSIDRPGIFRFGGLLALGTLTWVSLYFVSHGYKPSALAVFEKNWGIGLILVNLFPLAGLALRLLLYKLYRSDLSSVSIEGERLFLNFGQFGIHSLKIENVKIIGDSGLAVKVNKKNLRGVPNVLRFHSAELKGGIKAVRANFFSNTQIKLKESDFLPIWLWGLMFISWFLVVWFFYSLFSYANDVSEITPVFFIFSLCMGLLQSFFWILLDHRFCFLFFNKPIANRFVS